jgi:hypothetical protein
MMNVFIRSCKVLFAAAVLTALCPLAGLACTSAPLPNKAHVAPSAFLAHDFDGPHKQGIVGFWHVKFVAKAPNGTEVPVDAGYSVWHSDGTDSCKSYALENSSSRAGDIR